MDLLRARVTVASGRLFEEVVERAVELLHYRMARDVGWRGSAPDAVGLALSDACFEFCRSGIGTLYAPLHVPEDRSQWKPANSR